MISRSNGKEPYENGRELTGSKPKFGTSHGWDKAISVAYLRMIGQTQKQAANAVGVCERTIRHWEAAEWWGKAKNEASERWLAGLRGKAMVGLEVGVLADGSLALRVLERLYPELAPGALKIDLNADINVAAENARELIRNRIARLVAPEG